MAHGGAAEDVEHVVGLSYFARAVGRISSMRATSPCLIMETCSISWSSGSKGHEGYYVRQWKSESEDDAVGRSRARCGVAIAQPVEKRK